MDTDLFLVIFELNIEEDPAKCYSGNSYPLEVLLNETDEVLCLIFYTP